MDRRKFISLSGVTAATTITTTMAGCGSDDGGDDQEDRDEAEPAEDQDNAGTNDDGGGGDGDGNENEGDDGESTGTPRQEGEEERNAIGYPSEYIKIRDVEFKEPQDDYSGPVIEGVADNVYGEEISYVEVTAQAFNENDEQIDDAMANTSDLRAEKSWRFEMEFWQLDSKDDAVYWMGKSEVSDY